MADTTQAVCLFGVLLYFRRGYMSKREFKHRIKFGFSEWRKRKGIKQPQKPIKRSKYAQSFWDEGAGWNE